MLQTPRSRKTCKNCLRPLSVCYCDALVRVANQIKVLIIQHPLEKKHPFNTGRIAHLCLSNSELLIKETFSQLEMELILSTPSTLLYPSLSWLLQTVRPIELSKMTSEIQQLIVIDATWRKSKKILHLNPQLQALPRMSLIGDLSSNYLIRKTTTANGLSTLESIVKALEILEPLSDSHHLLKPFEKMIELQQLSSKSN